MIQKRLLTCLLIDLNKRKITIFCSVGRVYLINTTRLKKKKKLAHAYFERRIFLSLLAGKLATFEQMLLTEYMYHAYF